MSTSTAYLDRGSVNGCGGRHSDGSAEQDSARRSPLLPWWLSPWERSGCEPWTSYHPPSSRAVRPEQMLPPAMFFVAPALFIIADRCIVSLASHLLWLNARQPRVHAHSRPPEQLPARRAASSRSASSPARAMPRTLQGDMLGELARTRHTWYVSSPLKTVSER
jgi:hypothetical protein